MNPPVDFFVQGRSVRTATTRVSEPLHVMMIVFVDMQEGPVYLYSSLLEGRQSYQGLIDYIKFSLLFRLVHLPEDNSESKGEFYSGIRRTRFVSALSRNPIRNS